MSNAWPISDDTGETTPQHDVTDTPVFDDGQAQSGKVGHLNIKELLLAATPRANELARPRAGNQHRPLSDID